MNGDEAESALSTSPAANRLSIAHLLLWMTTTAIIYAVQSHFLPLAGADPDVQAPFATDSRLPAHFALRAIAYLAAPAYGAALAAVVLTIGRLFTNRYAFPDQPGHWLLLLVAVVPLAVGAVWLLNIPPHHENGAMAAAIVALALLAAAAGSLVTEPTRWNVAFVMASAGLAVVALKFFALASGGDEATYGLGYIFGGAAVIAVGCAVSLAFLSAAIDWHSSAPRDLFHWAGIFVFAIAAAHGLIVVVSKMAS